jgi:hypothetical protein
VASRGERKGEGFPSLYICWWRRGRFKRAAEYEIAWDYQTFQFFMTFTYLTPQKSFSVVDLFKLGVQS